PFDDSLNDSVGSNNLSGTMTYGSGVYGRAIDPTSQRAQTSGQTVHEFGTSDFAFTFWLRLDAVSGTQVIIGKRDPALSTNKGYRIYVNSAGKLVAEYCDGTAAVITGTSTFTLSANTWYFIKVSYDRDGFMAIYYNEVGDTSVSISAQQGSIATNGQTFTVASDSPSGSNYLNGRLDQLQVFSATVSDASAQEIFGNRHAMQLLGCMETGSGLTRGYLYMVNEENTALIRMVRSAGDVDTYLRLLAQGELRFADSDSSNHVAFKSAATVSSNVTWTLPSADGAASSKDVLSSNGAGILSLIAPNMKPLSIDDATTTQTMTAAETDIKTYSLAANSFTRIFVIIHGVIDTGDAGDANRTVIMRVKIGASTKSKTFGWNNFTLSATSSGANHIPFTLFYSAVQNGAATIAVSEDATSDDAQQSVSIDGFYVFGMNY
ncbi:MAG: LamG domain-containing protein, partial [Nitrososphaerales archaeon]